MKGKITRVKTIKLKKFGYGAFFISFSLERIPLLAPQVAIEQGGPRDPCMLKWVILMAHHRGGEGPMIWYTLDSFGWLKNKIIMIGDFPNECMNYTGDLDMSLPARM